MLPRINVVNAAFSYGGNHSIFEDISFQVNRGEVFCILGPNGVGKSTLLRCLCNLIKIKSGRVEIEGRDITSMSAPDLAKRVGFIPQLHYPTFPYTVREVVLMGRTPHLSAMATPSKSDVEIAEQAMEAIHITHLRNQPYTAISGGEMQLVLLARVLAQQSNVLLLDEPTSHLDIGNQLRTLELLGNLAQQGYSIMMTTHSPDQAFMSNSTVAMMKGGRFITVGPANQVITEEHLETAYGATMKVVHLGGEINRNICVPLLRQSTGR